MTDITIPRQRLRHQRAAPARKKSLYWAYGSNLNVEHMAKRCPGADPVAPLNLLHGALVFRGVADVTVRKNSEVPGGLWRITPQCERALDGYEGVWSRVYLKRYFTVEVDGEMEDVLFYQMSTHRGIMPPSEAYLRTIEGGYDDFGLDKAYLSAAIEQSWEDKDVTRMLRERHDRRGRPKLARPEPAFHLSEEDLKQAGAT